MQLQKIVNPFEWDFGIYDVACCILNRYGKFLLQGHG